MLSCPALATIRRVGPSFARERTTAGPIRLPGYDETVRRPLAWSIVLGLAVVGSQVAHAIAYRLVAPDGTTLAAALARSGHGYAAFLPLILAVAIVAVVAALAAEVRLATVGRSSGAPSSWGFALAAPAIFVLQEHFERLAHDGAFPWGAAGERTFVVGLALQVPFALAGLVVARLLLRVARSLGRRLAELDRAPSRPPAARWPHPPVALPRSPLPALGYATRGPPSPGR
jgi:hypothetical protein